MAQAPRYLVHVLDTDQADIETARAEFDQLGIYGKASAETFDGTHLPYGDHTINAIVVNDPMQVPVEELDRVLAPGGVLMVRGEVSPDGIVPQKWDKIGPLGLWRKPWPETIDQWPQFLRDASGNAVSRDECIYRPRHMQWYAGPRHSRHHDALSSLSAMTTGGGRMFYIFDEGATSLMHRPPHWKLIARDAFNGKLLWKRDIPTWMTHLYNFRAGPKQLPRRLVSVDDHVYTMLGLSAPIVKLDAATGETLLTYPGSEKAEAIVLHDDRLLAVIGDPELWVEKSDGCHGYWELVEYGAPTVKKKIVAYNTESGEILWSVTGDHLEFLAPLSLSGKGKNVFYLDHRNLHCLDASSGEERWIASFETEGLFLRSYAPTVVACEDVLLCLTWNRLRAYSVADGRLLWENQGAIGFGSPGDLFVIGEKVWTIPMRKSIWRESRRNKDGIVTTGIDIPKTDFLNEAKTAVALDLHTGEITDELPFAHTQHHHRCYRNKATENYLLIGHSGIQVVDPQTREGITHRWVRGMCQYGIMPANGLLYVPPDTCRCYGTGKINGFFALSDSNSWEAIPHDPVVRKKPAFSKVSSTEEPSPILSKQWPTYRGNMERSGSNEVALPRNLSTIWQTEIGPSVTAPVIADGKVWVAEKDAYQVYCLDLETGNSLWKFFANGPVDSPPTIDQGRCLFGCGDGSVYCLDARDGTLAWRFKTSKLERRIGHDDRLASPLTIHGSPLVIDGTVYFAAGYSSNLDGGIRLYGLEASTGKLRYFRQLASGPWGDDGKWGYLSDILVSNGEKIGMRGLVFDKELNPARGRGLLVATTGLLEDSWFHRMEWKAPRGRGQLIVFDPDRTYSVVNPYTGLKKRRKGMYKEFDQVGHFHQKFTRYREEFFPVGTVVNRASGEADGDWSKEMAFQPRAMVLAADHLCLAGWTDEVVIEPKTGRALDPSQPDPHDAFLRIYSAESGELVSQQPLSTEPVFDGMAVVEGKLLLCLKNGEVLCLGK